MLSAMFDVNQGLSIGSMLVLMLCAAACGLLIAVTARQFSRLSRPAGLLLTPYLAWVTFAGYLNLGIYLLN